MEKCNQCNCCEFDPTKNDQEKCICNHTKDAHESVCVPKPIMDDVRDSLIDLKQHKQRIKSELDHIDNLIKRLEWRFDLDEQRTRTEDVRG